MDLKELTELDAPSGHEQLIRRTLLTELEAMGIPASIDHMGNVVGIKKSTNPNAKRVLVDAHMDEVGLIITGHTDDGFLRFIPVGGVDSRVVISKRVRVGDDQLPGIIGAMAIHLQSPEDRKHVLSYNDIYIDIGARDRKEAEAKAPKGTYVAFETPYVPFGDGMVSAKALDDRVGCWSILQLLKEDLPHDVIAVFSSQEETGCRGAKGASFAQDPDYGIALEGTTCNDLGCVPAPLQVCRAGDGVAISFMDNASIGDRKLFAKAVETARKENILYQVKGSVSGGNNAGNIQRARTGIPTIVLSVPCRSIHSPSSVCALCDVEAQAQLAAALIRAL